MAKELRVHDSLHCAMKNRHKDAFNSMHSAPIRENSSLSPIPKSQINPPLLPLVSTLYQDPSTPKTPYIQEKKRRRNCDVTGGFIKLLPRIQNQRRHPPRKAHQLVPYPTQPTILHQPLLHPTHAAPVHILVMHHSISTHVRQLAHL